MSVAPKEDELLKLIATPGEQLWIGSNCPFEFESLLLLGNTNYRAPAKFHQKYDVIWAFEEEVSQLHRTQMPLYFDELLRLLKEEGRLVVRFIENDHITIFWVKTFLGRRAGVSVELEYETRDADKQYKLVFKIKRLHFTIYQNRDWTFAVLTQGKRLDAMVQFLTSIRKYDPENKYQIIVCGPRNEAYEPFHVEYHEKEYSKTYADIAAKKNDIAELAKHPNLMIAHDRYRLDDNFFKGFEEYGYDFDFVTINQYYETGEVFPAYCALTKQSHHFVWRQPIALTDFNRFHPLHFLNGGLLIFKTHVLQQIRFNPMLFWAQAEDVELTMRFAQNSLPGRINVFSSATTVGIKPDHTSTYLEEKSADNEHPKDVPGYKPKKVKNEKGEWVEVEEGAEDDEDFEEKVPDSLVVSTRKIIRHHFRKFIYLGTLLHFTLLIWILILLWK